MRLLATLSLTVLSGCSTHTQSLSPPSYTEQTEIRLASPVQQELPGPYGQPIALFIDSTTLPLKTQTIYHNYYCAPEGSAHAHHAIQGNITRTGDCIGVRTDRKSGKKEWVLNNSNFSNRATQWVKAVSE
jgi:hypothetical protein